MLQWAIRASGPIGAFLLLLSIYFTALVIRLFMEFRITEAVPPALVEKLETAIRDKKFQDAYDVCKDNDSFLAWAKELEQRHAEWSPGWEAHRVARCAGWIPP